VGWCRRRTGAGRRVQRQASGGARHRLSRRSGDSGEPGHQALGGQAPPARRRRGPAGARDLLLPVRPHRHRRGVLPGTAQEIPALLIPFTAATLAAHWSMIRSRGHYPTDVFGGAVGIGVALATWKLWPPEAQADERGAGAEKRGGAIRRDEPPRSVGGCDRRGRHSDARLKAGFELLDVRDPPGSAPDRATVSWRSPKAVLTPRFVRQAWKVQRSDSWGTWPLLCSSNVSELLRGILKLVMLLVREQEVTHDHRGPTSTTNDLCPAAGPPDPRGQPRPTPPGTPRNRSAVRGHLRTDGVGAQRVRYRRSAGAAGLGLLAVRWQETPVS